MREHGQLVKHASETTQFFIPELGLDVEPYIRAEQDQGIHHVGRYQWAAKVLKDFAPDNVLDIACGAGYGSKILSSALPTTTVVGSDYDERAIAYARKNYSGQRLRFTTGDLIRWTNTAEGEPLGLFDVVVCFDTIEHLLHREIALLRIAENLRPEGILLLSTPCGHTRSLLNPGWEHHKIEYSHSDLYKLLRRFFEVVIHPAEESFPNMEFWREVINNGKSRYLSTMNPVVCSGPISVCGRTDSSAP